MGLLDLIDFMQGNRPTQIARESMNRRDAFINSELPQIVTAIKNATTREELAKPIQDLAGGWLKAGLNPAAFDKFSEHLIKPAMEGLRAGEIDRIAGDMQPRTEVTNTPTPAPKGLQAMMPGADLSLPFSVESRPGRAFNQGDALRLAKYGDIPARLPETLTAPSAVQENEAQAMQAQETARLRQTQESRERTQQAIDEQQRGELEKMGGETGSVARATQGKGLAAYLNNERTREQLAPKVQAETGLAVARQGTEKARQGELGTRSKFNEAGVGLRNAQADKAGTAAAGGADTETEQDRFVKPEDQLLAERAIAKAAVDRGITKLPPEKRAAALAKLADDFGYSLEGDATINEPSGLMNMLGKGGPATMSGEYSLKPRPKRTTKSKTSGGKNGSTSTTAPKAGGKELDEETARAILQEAGGDKDKARQIAKQKGYKF